MLKAKFVTLVFILIVFSGCKEEKIENVTFKDLFYVKDIHDDLNILLADSLMFFGQDSQALNQFTFLLGNKKLSAIQLV